jgi:hypothetical protein
VDNFFFSRENIFCSRKIFSREKKISRARRNFLARKYFLVFRWRAFSKKKTERARAENFSRQSFAARKNKKRAALSGGAFGSPQNRPAERAP